MKVSNVDGELEQLSEIGGGTTIENKRGMCIPMCIQKLIIFAASLPHQSCLDSKERERERRAKPHARPEKLYIAKMEMEEPHENIIMIRGFPVSFPKVSNRCHIARMKRKT